MKKAFNLPEFMVEGDSEEEVRDTEEEGDDEDGDIDKEGDNFGNSNVVTILMRN